MSSRLRLTRRGRVVLGVLTGTVVTLVTVALLGLIAVPVREPDAPPTVTPTASPSPTPAPPRPLVLRGLDDGIVRVQGDEPTALAAGLARAMVREAPVVVVAPPGDRAAEDRAATLALQLRVPLLLDGPGLAGVLSELATTTVVDVGAGVSAAPERDVVVVTGRPVSRAQDEVAGVAQARGATGFERRLDWYRRAPDAMPAELGTRPAHPLPDPPTAVLVPRDEPVAHAAAVTAVALGHRVVEVGPDELRAQPDLHAGLRGTTASATVLVGEGVAWAGVDDEVVTSDLALVRDAPQLPGGGWRLLPDRMLVALYGSPGTPSLGMLGEQDVAAAIERTRAVAEEYAAHVDVPVVPTFEIIATVASAGAEATGDYSARVPLEVLQEWVAAAGAAGVYVVLDLQPGRTDFLSQAKELEVLLRQPHVGLALDPEWRLLPHQRHLQQVGSVGIEEVNAVADWLGALTREHRLPQKLLLLHQFTRSMIRDREGLTFPRELAVVIQMDGQGSQGGKLGTWDRIRSDAPDGIWWGWKNFEHEDRPMRGVADTVALEPRPAFVSYQ